MLSSIKIQYCQKSFVFTFINIHISSSEIMHTLTFSQLINYSNNGTMEAYSNDIGKFSRYLVSKDK